MTGAGAGNPSALPEIGFVVIGRNEGTRLQRCLESVLAVSHRLVYADSASTDDSVAVAKRLRVISVALPADGHLTAARGRNAGYTELRARFPDCEFVQFLDGDCILDPHWPPRAVTFMQDHPKVAVVCGRRFEARPEASIYNALCDREWDTPIGEADACGGDALVRSTAFDEVGGYRANLQAGEEPEMTARMRAAGWQVWRIDAPMTEHDANILTLRQWWIRTQRGGFGYAQVWYATRGLPRRIYGRQLGSALFWALVIPCAAIVAAIFAKNWLILLGVPVVYGLQLLRIAGYSHSSTSSRWTNAVLILLAKVPETLGVLRYMLIGSNRNIPQYKG